MAEAIITLPDGRRAKLTGPSREAILSQAQQIMQPGQIIPQRQPQPFTQQQLVPGVPGTTVSTVTQGSNEGALEASLRAGGAGIAEAAANTPNILLNAVRRVPAQLGFVPPEQAPSLAERVIPTPTGQQLIAGAETAVEAPVAAVQGQDINLSQMFGRNLTDAQQLAREHPTATTVGSVAGDIAMLAALRAPFARRLARRGPERITESQVASALEAVAKSNPAMAPRVAELIGSGHLASPGAQRLFRRALESEATQSALRGLGKAGETGLEGAVLATLQGNDPLQIAAFGATGQLATSLVGSTFGIPSSLKGLAWRAATYTALFRLGQEFIPGSEKNTYRAIDSSFDKVQIGMTLGLISQLVGGRLRGSRVGGRLAEDLPKITDAINTIPRGALLSFTEQVEAEQDRGETTSLTVMDKLASDPSFFGRTAAKRLNKALEKGTWDETIKSLMRSKTFRDKLEKIEE